MDGSLQQEGRFKLFAAAQVQTRDIFRVGLKPTMPQHVLVFLIIFDHPDPTLPKESDLCSQ